MKFYYAKFDNVNWFIDQVKPRGLSGSMTEATIDEFAMGSITKFVNPVSPSLSVIMKNMRICGHITDLVMLVTSLISGPNCRRCTFFVKKRAVIPTDLTLSDGVMVINSGGSVTSGDYLYNVRMHMSVDMREISEDDANALGVETPSLMIGCMDNMSEDIEHRSVNPIPGE
ncbi:TPA_asm: M [Pinellia alphacytorhabdovirus 1]|nr:TPA_asm: M [Pinellia alphacytorhabdovirus 1]